MRPASEHRGESLARVVVFFLVRLVAWAVLLVVAGRWAESRWIAHGLDGVETLRPLHELALRWFPAAVVVPPLLGGPLRELGVFVAGFILGVLVTAPFVLARLIHA